MPKTEITLKKDNDFVTRYGSTLEDENPSVIYLRTKSKITPIIDKKEYVQEVNKIKDKFTKFVEKSINQSKSINNDYIFNIDISDKSVRYGKVSFLRYDLYLKPSKKRTLKENEYRMRQFSIKMDKKLEKLLNSNKIICK